MPSQDSPSDDKQVNFLEEESAEERRELPRQVLHWALAFLVLFAVVFFIFWWSGAAIRFSASRVAEKPVPTWRITGTVRNNATHEPIPWALIEDDPAGRPPFFRADADRAGRFELTTLAEPHRIRVTATGYRSSTVTVGRQWFIWWPRGEEHRDVELAPE